MSSGTSFVTVSFVGKYSIKVVLCIFTKTFTVSEILTFEMFHLQKVS